jgi:hypothetical protein
MARKRTSPRKRRKAAAKRTTTAAPESAQAPAAPADSRLTDKALRAQVRKSKPVFNLFATFGSAKEAAEQKMERIRASMR